MYANLKRWLLSLTKKRNKLPIAGLTGSNRLMTGEQLDSFFGQQNIKDPERSKLLINTFNYKFIELAQLIDRHLPNNDKKKNVFEKLKELKAAVDCSAISE